ncbi:hypothetical protein D9M71_770900 [compost metagenome]
MLGSTHTLILHARRIGISFGFSWLALSQGFLDFFRRHHGEGAHVLTILAGIVQPLDDWRGLVSTEGADDLAVRRSGCRLHAIHQLGLHVT